MGSSDLQRKSSMKPLLAMLAGAADGALLVDKDGMVRFWNRAAERLLGFRASEVMERPCHDVMRGETLNGHALCSPSCPIGSRLAAIVGEDGLTESDKRVLTFAEDFERQFINQGDRNREIDETLDLGWRFLRYLPKDRLTRVKPEWLDRYYGNPITR